MQSVIVLIALLFAPANVLANDINAGFVSGFWYSNEKVFANETVRVYVAIRNNTAADLTGTVTYYANEKRLGSQSVSALNGRIIESWMDWTPDYGKYELRAELNRVKLSTTGEEVETVTSALAAATDSLFVDYDTDGDGIGNEEDLDDDGDGISDLDEIAAGTDPLAPNTSDNTLTDGDSPTDATAANSVHEQEATDSTTQAGLERYLTPSRADTLLTNVTNWTDTTKQKLDNYRETKRGDFDQSERAVTVVNSDGFGEVVRSTDPSRTSTSSKNQGNDFITGVIDFGGNTLNLLFSSLLAFVSWTLGYAMFVQLLLLFGILGGTYYLARKFGGRPNGKR